MKKNIFALLFVAVSCRNVFAARLIWDHAPNVTMGGWQSLTSEDQAFGVSKRLVHLDQDTQPLLNLGVFAGGSKSLVGAPASSPRLLGGATLAVPGSLLDWALGTDWGSKWLPALKTGVLCAYDITRPKMLKLKPDFLGVGVNYPLGGL